MEISVQRLLRDVQSLLRGVQRAQSSVSGQEWLVREVQPSSVTWTGFIRGRERSVSDDPPFVNAVYSPVSSVESRVAGWRSGTFPHASCGFFTGKL